MYILELSKVLMYKSHYDYVQNKYGKNSILFTDVDSLMYEMNVWCHINVSNDKEMFDYSNCWTSSKH